MGSESSVRCQTPDTHQTLATPLGSDDIPFTVDRVTDLGSLSALAAVSWLMEFPSRCLPGFYFFTE